MPDWGVTNDGYYLPPYEEIRAHLESTYKGEFGQTTNTDRHTPDGRFVSFCAEVLRGLYEDDQANYESAFIDSVDGVSFDLWLASRGFKRNPARATVKDLAMQGTPGTVVLAGALIRDTVTRELFELQEDHTIESPAARATFVAQNTGPILVDGAVWEIVTGTTGWTGVLDDDGDELVGQDLETVSAAKIRYLSAIIGGSVKRELLKLAGVTRVRVFENDTDDPDPIHDATHWLEAMVVGGNPQEIVDTIARFKAPGVGTEGDSSGVETFSGEVNTIRYSRGTDVDIYLTVQISAGEGFPSDAATAIQIRNDLVQFGEVAHEHGDDVAPDMFRGQISATVPGGRYSATVLVGTSPSPSASDIISIDDREVARFSAANTSVVFV